jgi:dienelactone hydrolase
VLLSVIATASTATSDDSAHYIAQQTPDLSGSYAVGRREYVWTDLSRPEYGGEAGTHRTLIVWIWYPAAPTSAPASTALPQYWEEPMIQAMEARSGHSRTDLAIKAVVDRQHAIFHRHIHTIDNAAPVASPRALPVVLFSPGGGDMPTDYTYLIENLVSHGFVVAGIHPTGFTMTTVFPDRHVVGLRNGEEKDPAKQFEQLDQDHHWWVEDARFTLDQLANLSVQKNDRLLGRMDLFHVGIFGHSYGGTTSVEVCHADKRFTAGANLDGTMYSDSVTQPFLLVDAHSDVDFNGTYWQSHPANLAYAREAVARWRPFFEKSPQAIFLTIPGTDHGSFNDDALDGQPSPVPNNEPMMDPRKALILISNYVDGFFEASLKGKPTALFDRAPQDVPNISIRRHDNSHGAGQ